MIYFLNLLENIKEPLKIIRRALLEADVSLPVVRRMIKKIEEDCIGTKVRTLLKHITNIEYLLLPLQYNK